jgi:hypothetical protein
MFARPIDQTPLRRGFFIAATCVLLAGCKPRDEVKGSPELPEAFGRLAAHSSACESVAGTYRWPSVAGAAQGYTESGTLAPRGLPAFFRLDMPREGELRIAARTDGGLRFEVKDTSPDARSRLHLNSHQDFRRSDVECRAGWISITEYEHPHLEARSEFAGRVMVGAKLARLADGDLAIGQWLRVTDRSASLYTWADRSVGSRPLADRVTWYWSRYAQSRPAGSRAAARP